MGLNRIPRDSCQVRPAGSPLCHNTHWHLPRALSSRFSDFLASADRRSRKQPSSYCTRGERRVSFSFGFQNKTDGELFADDGNGIIGGKDIEYMAQRLNRVCRDLSTWGKKCGLTFNARKTVVLLFTKSSAIRKKYGDKKLVKTDGLQIPLSDSVKYLGVTLDSKLSWKPHIEAKTSACKN